MKAEEILKKLQYKGNPSSTLVNAHIEIVSSGQIHHNRHSSYIEMHIGKGTE